MSQYCHITDQAWSPRPLPGAFGDIAENYQSMPTERHLADGWRVAVPAVAPDGLRIVTSTVAFTDAMARQVITATASLADEAAAAAQAAFLADAERLSYGNAFLLMCDRVTAKDDHRKLSFEELPGYLLAIKAANREAYEDARDAFDLINSACFKKFGLDWWDRVEWTEHPAIIENAQKILQAGGVA